MVKTVALTSNFQIHIPKEMREALGITEPQQIELKLENNKLIVSPFKKDPILEMAGMLSEYNKNVPKDFDLDNLRDFINYADM